jgi:hypothetical protein
MSNRQVELGDFVDNNIRKHQLTRNLGKHSQV